MNNTEENRQQKESLNPMTTKKHTLATRKKISASQKERYAIIRKAISENYNGLILTQTDSKIRTEALKQLQTNNNISLISIQQAINFLAIMLNQEQYQKIIREEIDKMNTYGKV